jgi:hypothetical protein
MRGMSSNFQAAMKKGKRGKKPAVGKAKLPPQMEMPPMQRDKKKKK